jgi:hypothetical protein
VGDLAGFLIQPAREGYPTDYLLARVRGRRADLVSDWLAPPGPPGSPAPLQHRATARGMTAKEARGKMQQEFRWVYLQMNQALRDIFAPLFLWFEVRSILISLRLHRGGEQEQAAGLLGASLLSQRVQRVLRGEEEPFSGADALSQLLQADAAAGRELGTLYREGKGREYEERFVALYLERVMRLALPPVLGEFFSSLVDLANLLAVAKQMRWRLEEPRALIGGGTIATERLEKVLKEGSAAGLAALLRDQRGPGGEPAQPGNLEHFLLCRLTRKLRKLAKDPLGIGCILAYLWQCYIEARNAGLVHHAAVLGDETLGAELIG